MKYLFKLIHWVTLPVANINDWAIRKYNDVLYKESCRKYIEERKRLMREK